MSSKKEGRTETAAGHMTFANTFVMLDETSLNAKLENVSISDQLRKKRAHRKSRQGCVECKRRRVKCDERFPCSNCVKRHDQCVRPGRHDPSTKTGSPAPEKQISRSLQSPRFESAMDFRINMMHLQLFNHFEKVTVSTLSLPELWPEVLRLAFYEEHAMSIILCVAATHLAILHPQEEKYSYSSMQLLSNAIRLFRQDLNRPVTIDNCVARAGATCLVNYILWCNMDFVRGFRREVEDSTVDAEGDGPFDLSKDLLFPLSPGVLQIFFQGLPVFMKDPGVFLTVARHRPRANIEMTLVARGDNPARYMAPFMRMFDDPAYQTCSPDKTEQSRASLMLSGAMPRAWMFHVEVEAHIAWKQLETLYPKIRETLICHAPEVDPEIEAAADLLISRFPPLTTDPIADAKFIPVLAPLRVPFESTAEAVESLRNIFSARSAFQRIMRRLSPILCCLDFFPAAPAGQPATVDDMIARHERDLRRLLFSFPILCYGPFLELVMANDSRALVVLYHFYRAVRILLPMADAWWAHGRSRVMEKLILRELTRRGLDVCLRNESEE